MRRRPIRRPTCKQLQNRLEGKPLKPFVYRDFGSLVSLGKYSTVGNLMGKLVGGNMMIEGYFARMMYVSLYKMHLWPCDHPRLPLRRSRGPSPTGPNRR